MIPLGRILGIPVELDYSWFLIFVLITWTMAVGYYPAEFKNWPVAQYWFMGAVTAIMLFVSVLLHELGHSVVAMRYKVPVRSITLYIFGGISLIGTEPPTAAAGFSITIAGPFVSFALAALFSLIQPFFAGVTPLLALFKYLAYINVALGLFNLIPGFPLDGECFSYYWERHLVGSPTIRSVLHPAGKRLGHIIEQTGSIWPYQT